MTLYHWTCAHGHADITKADGIVMPFRMHNPKGAKTIADDGYDWMADLAWFTDLDTLIPAALGIAQRQLTGCRTLYRWRATYPDLMMRYVDYRRKIPLDGRRLLEATPGVMPMHWWVTLVPVATDYAPA